MSEQANVLSLLDSDNPEDIREGAWLAGNLRMEEAVPALARNIASPNIGVQEAVDRALRDIGGPGVVHAVIPLLRSEEAPVRNIAMDLLRAQGSSDFEALNQLMTDDDPDIRIFASDILGSTDSVQAVPPLCKALLQDPEVNVRYQAAVSLGELAFPEAAPALNKALRDEEWVQFSVIEALTKIKDDSSILPLLSALDGATDLVASTIVEALGEMGNIKAIPLLLKGLDSSPTPLANKIVKAVIKIMGGQNLNLLGAKDCQRLRGYLHVAIEDEDPEIQDAAIYGFACLGGDTATSAILALGTRLDAEKDAPRLVRVIEALAAIGNADDLEEAIRTGDERLIHTSVPAMLLVDEQRAVNLLADLFWATPRDLQRWYIHVLAEHSGAEKRDFFLDVLARHEDGNVLHGALLFLGKMGQDRKVQEQVIALLNHPYNDVKEAALEALISLHTPELEEFFRAQARDRDPMQRIMALYALSRFDPAKFSDEFKNALEDPSPEVRKLAVEAFGLTCSLDMERMVPLVERINDENREVRMAVVTVLGSYTDGRYMDVLLRGLDDPAPWVQVRCIERLGEIGDQDAAERLVGLLRNDNNLIVIKSIEALGAIGGQTAFRALLPFMDNPDPDIQAAAMHAVESIRARSGEV